MAIRQRAAELAVALAPRAAHLPTPDTTRVSQAHMKNDATASNRKRPTRPHPNPLPMGEEVTPFAQRAAHLVARSKYDETRVSQGLATRPCAKAQRAALLPMTCDL